MLYVGTDNRGIYVSHDDGMTWAQSSLTGASVTDLTASANGKIFASLLNGSAITTVDVMHGDWSPVSDLRGHVSSLDCTNEGNTMATTMDSGLFLISDREGKTWCTSSVVGIGLIQVHFSPSYRTYVATMQGDIYQMDDAIDSWSLIAEGHGLLSGMVETPDRDLVVSTVNSGIYAVSTKYGAVRKAQGSVEGVGFYGLARWKNSCIVAAGFNSGVHISSSSDSEWTQAGLDGITIQALHTTPDKSLLAGTQRYGVLRGSAK